jgi:metallophosphoesterase superfamily enzyme
MRGLNYGQIEEEMREKGIKIPRQVERREDTLIQRILRRLARFNPLNQNRL